MGPLREFPPQTSKMLDFLGITSKSEGQQNINQPDQDRLISIYIYICIRFWLRDDVFV
jgi:hypothetical protein